MHFSFHQPPQPPLVNAPDSPPPAKYLPDVSGTPLNNSSWLPTHAQAPHCAPWLAHVLATEQAGESKGEDTSSAVLPPPGEVRLVPSLERDRLALQQRERERVAVRVEKAAGGAVNVLSVLSAQWRQADQALLEPISSSTVVAAMASAAGSSGGSGGGSGGGGLFKAKAASAPLNTSHSHSSSDLLPTRSGAPPRCESPVRSLADTMWRDAPQVPLLNLVVKPKERWASLGC
jgi:hypothetical protein